MGAWTNPQLPESVPPPLTTEPTYEPTPAYAPPEFGIDAVDLRVRLFAQHAEVHCKLAIRPALGDGTPSPIRLDGRSLQLRSLKINDQPVPADDYDVTPHGLTLRKPPATGARSFELATVVRIDHVHNRSFSGLYKSHGIVLTQCEPQGFRRISYFPDRPDVRPGKWTVTVEAPRGLVMLSNGQEVERGQCADDPLRVYAKFVDQVPKPCYLVCLVVGVLKALEQPFVTRAGKQVALRAWAAPHECEHAQLALQSLEKALRFDETTFGATYGHGVYNIVGVQQFNSGAMENTGLNVFNAQGFLFRPARDTDLDYAHVVSVTGHEAFHYHSGNRTGIREWSDLTLKEGLTTLRQQLFEQDQLGSDAQRIEHVGTILGVQFPQNATALAHAVRPARHLDTTTLYNSTTYNLGAEVFRMMRTILGPTAFAKGIGRFFADFRDTVATCEDVVRSMPDPEKRLGTFSRWFDAVGTPTVHVWYDASPSATTKSAAREVRIEVRQDVDPPLTIPLQCALLDAQTGRVLGEALLLMTEATQAFVFEHVTAPSGVVLSLHRDFSAPVRIVEQVVGEDGGTMTLTVAQRQVFLARHEPNACARWLAIRGLQVDAVATQYALRLEQKRRAGNAVVLHPDTGPAERSILHLVEALEARLDSGAVSGHELTFPGLNELMRPLANVDYDVLFDSDQAVRRCVAQALRPRLEQCYAAEVLHRTIGTALRFGATDIEGRLLQNRCLALLSFDPQLHAEDGGAGLELRCLEQLRVAKGGTEEMGALRILAPRRTPSALHAFAEYRDRAIAESDEASLLRYARLRAGSCSILELDDLMQDPALDLTSPNMIRATLGTFAHGNRHFHAHDGSGYACVAGHVLALDAHNPNMARGLLQAFMHFDKFADDDRRAHMRTALERVAAEAGTESTRALAQRIMGAAGPVRE